MKWAKLRAWKVCLLSKYGYFTLFIDFEQPNLYRYLHLSIKSMKNMMDRWRQMNKHTHTLPNQVFGLTFWPKYQRSFAYALVWPFSIRNLRKIHFYSRAMRDWKMVINKLQLQTLLTTYIYHGRCYDSIQDQPMPFQNQAFHADLNCVFRRRENQLKKNSTQQIFETKP